MPPETILSLETDWALYDADPEALFARAGYAAITPVAGPAREAQADGRIPFQMVPGTGIAVVSITGIMEKRMSMLGSLFGGTSMLAVKAAINAAIADKSVSSILLRIDSPGGTVSGTTDLSDHIAAASRRKRLVAYVDGTAASAAYWAGSQAQEMWASRDSLVGSIGVYGVIYDKSEMAKREGIKPVVISTGKYKGEGAPGTKISAEQIAEWRKRIEFSFSEFKAAVGRGRGMSATAVAAVADGRVFHPPESVDLKLIDRVMSFEDAVATLAGEERSAQESRNARAQGYAALRKIREISPHSDSRGDIDSVKRGM